jgi:hypothetical protein
LVGDCFVLCSAVLLGVWFYALFHGDRFHGDFVTVISIVFFVVPVTVSVAVCCSGEVVGVVVVF